MITQAVRSFFTLRPKRDVRVSNLTAFWLSLAIVLTQVGDTLTTIIGLGAGAAEANGVMARFIQEQGFMAFAGLKAFASAFLIWVFWKRPAAAAFVVCLYTAVIVNNLVAIFMHL